MLSTPMMLRVRTTSLLKREVEFKNSDIPSFVKKMGNLEQKQAKDAESALFGHGPYSLAPAYKSLRIEQHKWFKLNAKQRESFIHKFWNMQVNDGKSNSTRSIGCGADIQW